MQPASAHNAGVIILVGAGATLLGTASPWLLTVVLGISVVAARPDVVLVLAALAVLSGLIAMGVLLRRPAPPAVALGLIVLALAQLCLAAWDALSVLQGLAVDDPRLVAGRAIGTGVYMGLLGASLTVAGSILAWRSRAASPGIVVNPQ